MTCSVQNKERSPSIGKKKEKNKNKKTITGIVLCCIGGYDRDLEG